MRSWWGWGETDAALTDEECGQLGAQLPGLPGNPLPVPDIPELPAPRVRPPESLPCTADVQDRASHAYGKAYRDVVRSLHGQVTAPDLIARPRGESDVAGVLDWASDAGVVVVPYGGGSSVVGGVEYRGQAPWLSLDLSALDRVLEVDDVSRAARIQAGVLGPALEDQLRPLGYTMRFFPQSFEFSSLGGWLATRAGGHYATGPTHVDDFVESLRVVTPSGVSQSWRLPASGAGPSPDRLFLGSEGILGVITEAWLRLQRRPAHKASTSVSFPRVEQGFDAVRAIAQSGLYPANCRLLDPGEAGLSGAARDGSSVLVLGFESAEHPVDDGLAAALDLARQHGGTPAPSSGQSGSDAVGSWRSAFLRMPYLRDGLARMSAITETFETACTWDNAADLYHSVRDAVAAAIREVTGAEGVVNCRTTHAYPDGVAPYFTVIAAARRGSELAMWD
ncbi:MAG: FAD-binding oxidoreductase, partial [Thermocrispum sp.]